MAFDPKRNLEYTIQLIEYYAALELQLLELVSNHLDKTVDDENLVGHLSQQVTLIRGELSKKLKDVDTETKLMLNDMISNVYIQSMIQGDNELEALNIDVGAPAIPKDATKVTGAFGIIHQEAISAIIAEQTGVFNKVHFQILRSTEDIYRQVILQSTATLISGAETRRQAAQRVMNQFASKGIVGFVDKAGRQWNLASYTEMATRTAVIHANLNGHMNRLAENGNDLIIVSDHRDECPVCRPWEGKILSVSGNTPGYATVSDAKRAGLWHPHCGHTSGVYIKGLTQPMGKTSSDKDAQGYEEKQQQRAIERNIRTWKKREMMAITDEEAAKSKAKVKEWQGTMREFLKNANSDQRRDYGRESITRAR